MAHVSKVSVSRLIAESADNDAQTEKKSRGDYKKQKELEEMRKLGTAPAAVDEEGRDINPHIPQYISDAPWYLDPRGPTLTHQRQQEEKIKKYSDLTEWYKKGVDVNSIATKFRKGACENCGAMTHQKRDCLERPRKIGAKFTNANFAPDEFVQPDLSLTFDGKRDRWNGYDNFAHQEVVEEYQKLEEVKRELKKERLLKSGDEQVDDDDGAPSSDEDEDKYVDKMDMPGTKVDAAERYTVRNLRIREDTAKYLRNLDPNSAYYDPKTRSMRKNPYENTGRPVDEVEFAGDNFVRISGDTVNHAQSQLFAWEAGHKGLDVHALAEPTKLEVLKKEYSAKKDDFKEEVKSKILEKYGGEEYLDAPPKELIFAQTEHYVEYTRHGQVIKGEERATVRSRYEEDVLNGNHTTVWGSYWFEGRWGYKCCQSVLKNSYCTGAAGKEQDLPVCTSVEVEKSKESNPEITSKKEESEKSAEESSSEEEEKQEKHKKKKKKKDKKKKKSKRKNKDKEEKDFDTEVAEAMKKQEEEERKAEGMTDDRKRNYNNLLGFDAKAPTEAEMEAFYKRRKRDEDPMMNF